MGILSSHLQYIKDREDVIEQELGQEIEVINLGTKTACPNPECKYDSFYKQSTNPDCPVCGGKWWIYPETKYTRKVLVRWIVGVEEEEVEAGILKVGDCRVKGDYDDLSIYQTALDEKTLVTMKDTDDKFFIRAVTPTALRTSVLVYLVRKEEES